MHSESSRLGTNRRGFGSRADGLSDPASRGVSLGYMMPSRNPSVKCLLLGFSAEARALMADNRGEPRLDGGVGLLGGVPHTIRGSLWSYDTRMTVTHRFPACTACSTPSIEEYRKRGTDFILDACNEPNYLERLTGLEDLLKRPDLDEVINRLLVYFS